MPEVGLERDSRLVIAGKWRKHAGSGAVRLLYGPVRVARCAHCAHRLLTNADGFPESVRRVLQDPPRRPVGTSRRPSEPSSAAQDSAIGFPPSNVHGQTNHRRYDKGSDEWIEQKRASEAARTSCLPAQNVRYQQRHLRMLRSLLIRDDVVQPTGAVIEYRNEDELVSLFIAPDAPGFMNSRSGLGRTCCC